MGIPGPLYTLKLTNVLNMRRALAGSSFWGTRRFGSACTAKSLSTGSKIDNFTVQSIREIPELGVTGILMRHPTGATALHLAKDDSNCTFSVAFRTFPRDSTGAPHILEHLALCGSRRYPIRDPFFKMLNRSLATYMNAWTGRDWTMYPFATRNIRDYENLRGVYMDAAFRPLLREEDFRQEGWRLEKDEDKWKISGVVYNEMKGAFSDAESLFSTRCQQQMFPGTSYSHVSGGDPLAIPSLSHRDLVDFCRSHYHPANALFYSYGNLELETHLSKLDETLGQIMADCGEFTPLRKPMDGFQPFANPKSVEIMGSIDPMSDPNKQIKMITSFITNPITNSQTTFNMQILSSLLLDGPAAPLYKALIESNIGSEYAPGTGYDSSLATTTFSAGLQGITADNVPRVEELVLKTLEQVRNNGFPAERINSVVHQIQLGLRYHSADFGLGLVQRAASSWVHEQCPLSELAVMEKVNAFRKQYDEGGLFERLIDQMMESKHRLTFVMRPDSEYNQQQDKLEAELVEKLVGQHDQSSLEGILEKNRKLLESQDRVEDKSLLPCLGMADISESIEKSPYAKSVDPRKNLTIFSRESPKANGLTYFKSKVAIKLPKSKIALLPMLTNCLTELGVENMPIDEFDGKVRATCAGLNVSVHQERPTNESIDPALSLVLSSHALEENASKMFDLFGLAISKTNWQDLDRIRTHVNGALAGLANSIAGAGSSFALSLAAAPISSYRYNRELLSGISQIRVLKQLSADIEGTAKLLQNVLYRIAAKNAKAIAVITQDATLRPMMERSAQQLMKLIPAAKTRVSFKSTLPVTTRNYALEMPFTTNYVAQVFGTNPFDDNLAANLSILARLASSQFLHREIREKGGAYGGSASYSRMDGLFALYSYRDPDPLNTIKVFSCVADWLKNSVISESDLLEAKLAVFGDLDKPQDVAMEGLQQFFHGMDDISRQTFRDALMRVTAESLKQSGQGVFQNTKKRTVALLEEGGKHTGQLLGFKIDKYE
ncbi:hypothetical protein PSACC_01827 [Paramicrosporidium saccamoebae]|uniref:Presequence protease, mitochondrial n=1 Tax=Paramicrosporidium saccamoebae TaxID=1246581 RepID=A0A2H9TKT0_9FUNG|nr:hypothetical protein PSACC_01827 [Paramicrosporidium saccamoebae]